MQRRSGGPPASAGGGPAGRGVTVKHHLGTILWVVAVLAVLAGLGVAGPATDAHAERLVSPAQW